MPRNFVEYSLLTPWKAGGVASSSTPADAYRRSFATLCVGLAGELLDHLPVGPLLDVGCGTGELADLARRRGFDVFAIDEDAATVTVAGQTIPGRVTLGALPDLPVPDAAFSAVTANFVINHVRDPRAAMAELARITAPDGRTAVTIWPTGGAAWTETVADVFAAAGASPTPQQRLPPGLDFPRSCDGLRSLARDAGLQVVVAGEHNWTWRVTPADLWAGIAGGIATAGATYLAQDSTVRSRIGQLFFTQMNEAAGATGHLAFESRAVFVVASP